MEALTHLINNKALVDFVFAGDAIFTMENESNMKRYTYWVVEKAYDKGDGKGEQRCWWVHVFTGKNNWLIKDYTYIGCIFPNNKYLMNSSKSRFGQNENREDATQSIVGFNWLLKRIHGFVVGSVTNVTTDPVYVRHAGRCGRCHKLLTVTDSIEAGFGSVCSKNVSAGRQRKKTIAQLTTTTKERKNILHDVEA